MNKISGYTDLNIPIGSKCEEVCEAAVKCGYTILAINTPVLARNVTGQGNPKRGGKKRKWEERSGGILASTAATVGNAKEGIPKPEAPKWMEKLLLEYPGVRILQRLTVIFAEVLELQNALSQENAKQYDLFAVIPTNHEALQTCITATAASLVFDIISFDLEGPHWINKLRLNRTKGNLAAEKEIVFELTYASALHGDSACENMIYAANCLTEDICVKKIKNMIITSGASKAVEVKGPKDVSSLGYLLGLDETTIRHCIRDYAHRIISKSELRKYGRTWAAFIPSSTSESDQKELSSMHVE